MDVSDAKSSKVDEEEVGSEETEELEAEGRCIRHVQTGRMTIT